MSTIRNFEHESAGSSEPTREIDANISTNMIDGELFVEIRTVGPVGEDFSSDDVQVFRFSKNAIQQLTDMRKFI